MVLCCLASCVLSLIKALILIECFFNRAMLGRPTVMSAAMPHHRVGLQNEDFTDLDSYEVSAAIQVKCWILLCFGKIANTQ